MRTLLQDLRFAFRQLGRAPGFAITAILTLALGIGANTAIFSLVNSLVLKPLPVENPQQIAGIAASQNHGPVLPFLSWQEFRQLRAQSKGSFSEVIANALSLDGIATEGQQPQRIMTSFVSGNFFSMLGLKPAVGRLFLPSEGDVLGQDPVIVLEYDYWKDKFNGDPGVVGRPVTVDGHPLTIVGVAPKGFQGVQSFVAVQAFLPLSQKTIEGTPAEVLNKWDNRGLNVYGRLLPGVNMKQATAALGVVAKEMTRQQPEAEKGEALSALPEQSLRITTGDPNAVYVMAGLFLSLAAMVLLLACVNVANLVLVRATVREREMAIRAALGARRVRLLRQMITESVLLAVMGGSAGVIFGMWGRGALRHLNIHADIPITLAFGFDWRCFVYSFAIALVAGIVVGVVPALRVARTNVNGALREGSHGTTRGKHWLRDTLVALQMAGSLVLLVVAALFVRSLTAMQTMDFGFKPDQMLNLSMDPAEIGMSDAQTRVLTSNLLDRLHQLAGVESVSHAGAVPMGYFGVSGDSVVIDGTAAPANPTDFGVGYNVVTPEYFQTMGIRLLGGRAFTDADNEHGRDVAVISESMARKYWPNQDAMGRTFRKAAEKDRKLEVVGIVRDAEFQLFGGGKTRPFFYVPYAQHFAGNSLMVFQLKTKGEPMAMAATVVKSIHEAASDLPLFEVQSMRQGLYTLNGLLLFQIAASLATIMGGLGLTLAVIGLYGVVSYAVSRRVHEIGLRMALGASRGSVFRMIYRQSILMIGGGLGFGLALALLVARTVGSFVVVSAFDPVSYLVVSGTLAVAALGSCYLPARRAMAVEPMVALRED